MPQKTNYSGLNKKVCIFGNFHSWKINYKAPCEELSEKLEMKGWTVVKASKRTDRIGKLVDMLKVAIIERKKYDLAVVEIYSGPAFLWAEIISATIRLLNKPLILVLHGGNLPSFSEKWPKRVMRLLKSATCVIAPSNYLIEKMKFFRSDILLIPNPINIDYYPYRLRVKVRNETVWLRKFRYIYQPHNVAYVIENLSKSRDDTTMTMIGPDSKDGSLERTVQLAKDLKVDKRLKIIGGVPKEQIPYYLNLSDIFLNTTAIDNTPISLIEAMACGLCIVSTNAGGIPYLIEHEKEGLLVPVNEPEKMAKAIKRILSEPRLAERLSKNSRKKAENFDWKIILPKWESLLKSSIKA